MHEPSLVTLLVGLLTRSTVWVLLAVAVIRALPHLRADRSRYVGAAFILIGCLVSAFSSALRAFGDAHYHVSLGPALGYISTLSTVALGTGVLLMLIRGVEHVTGREWRPWRT